jgi:hypothetical protein
MQMLDFGRTFLGIEEKDGYTYLNCDPKYPMTRVKDNVEEVKLSELEDWVIVQRPNTVTTEELLAEMKKMHDKIDTLTQYIMKINRTVNNPFKR